MDVSMKAEVLHKSPNPISVWSSGVIPDTEIGTSLCVSPYKPGLKKEMK
jgi:hypothetical protein